MTTLSPPLRRNAESIIIQSETFIRADIAHCGILLDVPVPEFHKALEYGISIRSTEEENKVVYSRHLEPDGA